VANQGDEIILKRNIKQGMQPLDIHVNRITVAFSLLKPFIVLLRDEPGFQAFVVEAEPHPIPIIRYRTSANWADIAPLATLSTQRGVPTRVQHVLDIAAAATQVPSCTAVLNSSLLA
jgi:hypothetical protein